MSLANCPFSSAILEALVSAILFYTERAVVEPLKFGDQPSNYYHEVRFMPMLRFCFALTISLILVAIANGQDDSNGNGYVSLFDGKTLNGWDGNPKFWN